MAPFQQKHLPAHYRRPVGRPSEYKPEYCDLVIERMGQGYSLTAFAGSIRVSKDAVYEWIKAHGEFADAVSRARPARLTALETKLLRSRKGAETTAAIFALRNADPEEWRDVKHQEHLHSVKVETLTDAQLYAIAAQQRGADDTAIDGEFTRVDTR
jgi:hypothetical protein